MPTFAGLAALASVAFVVAGVIVLFLIALARRSPEAIEAEPDELGEMPDAPPFPRRVPPAYGIALGCFAAAAACGVLGVMQRSPGPLDQLVERIQALEHRLAIAEVDLETRMTAAPPVPVARGASDGGASPRSTPNAPHRSLASATSRERAIGRASTSAPRSASSSSAEQAFPVAPPASDVAPSTSTSSETGRVAASHPEPPSPTPYAPVAVAPVPPVAAPQPAALASAPGAAPADRDVRRPATQPDSSRSLVDKVRGDWEAIKRAASEAGDDWVDGWRRLRRLLAN